MTKLTRREALFCGVAAFSVTATANTAAAGGDEPMRDMYLAVTRAAFEATYGDNLSPANIERLSFAGVDKSTLSAEDITRAYETSIAAVLAGTAAEYQANYVAAAKEYFKTLSKPDLEALTARIEGYANDASWAPDTWKKVVAEDAARYSGNWKTGTLEAGNTNALFYAFQTLVEDREFNEDRGMLTQDGANSWVQLAKNLTHGGDNLALINAQVVKAAEEVLSAAPAVPAVAPAPVIEKTF